MDKKIIFGKIRWMHFSLFLLGLFVFAAGLACFFLILPAGEDSIIEQVIVCILGVITIVSGSFIALSSIRLVIWPMKSCLFKRFGGVEKVESIFHEIQNTTEYTDKAVVISREYCYSPKNIEGLVAFDDILMVHKIVHKYNGSVTSYEIAVTNHYGQQTTFRYHRKNEKICDAVMVMICAKCSRAVFGYSKENKAYVEKNKLSLKDLK